MQKHDLESIVMVSWGLDIMKMSKLTKVNNCRQPQPHRLSTKRSQDLSFLRYHRGTLCVTLMHFYFVVMISLFILSLDLNHECNLIYIFI